MVIWLAVEEESGSAQGSPTPTETSSRAVTTTYKNHKLPTPHRHFSYALKLLDPFQFKVRLVFEDLSQYFCESFEIRTAGAMATLVERLTVYADPAYMLGWAYVCEWFSTSMPSGKYLYPSPFSRLCSECIATSSFSFLISAFIYS
jgi:hypothetical protein